MLLILDFESMYDPSTGYSLGKMPTLQYIRDPRWSCLGCGVQVGNRLPKYLKPEHLPGFFDSLDWSSVVAVAHNAQFDGAVLAHHYYSAPSMWIDTLAWTRYAISQGALPPDSSTSLRAWGERLGLAKGDTAQATGAGGAELEAYGLRDIEITRKALEWLYQHCPLPTLEAQAIDLHVRMAVEPKLHLDTALLERLAADKLDPDIAKVVRSREKFASALVAAGVTPGTKTSPATGKETYAFAKTDKFMRDLQRHPSALVRKLAELKTEGGSTIVASRAQRFLDVGSPLPAPLLYYGAHTGRASGADGLNLQNMPRGSFRNALGAPPGYKIAAADYSQIEARVVAWGAQDEAAMAPFLGDRDPYKVVASQDLYAVPYDEVTAEQRQRAKAAVLALGFGQGATGFVSYCEIFGIEMSHREAEQIVGTWRASRPRMVQWWYDLHDRAVADGELLLPSGRKLTYPDMTRAGRALSYTKPAAFSKLRGRRDEVNLWHGLVAENWVQAVARDIIYHAAVRMPYPVVLMVHDEVVMIVPEDVDTDAIERVMLDVPDWAEGLPVACEIAVADNYGEAK